MRFRTPAILDWGVLKGADHIVVKTTHNLVERIEKQNEFLKSIAESLEKFSTKNAGVWAYVSDSEPEAQKRHDEAARDRRQMTELRRKLVPHEFPDEPSVTPADAGETEPRSTEPDPESPAEE